MIFQNYKKPLYVGIKALRNIRRDLSDIDSLKQSLNFSKFTKNNNIENKNCFEIANNAKDFYSLFECNNQSNYNIYKTGNRSEKINLKSINEFKNFDKITIYPNTIDFEYLDTNARRNEIYYSEENSKRKNRPFSWEEWNKFLIFKEVFENKKSELNKIISLIYSKLEDWKQDEENLSIFMKSTFVNLLNLNSAKNKQTKDKILELFEIDSFNKLEQLKIDKLQKFIDMYEFWHKCLKEV